MSVSEEIDRRRVPCGPVTVAVEGVCRRRLKDIMDRLLDRLSQETSQEFQPPEAPEGHEIVDGKVVSKDADKTPEAKGQKMLEEGLVKNEVKAKLKEHASNLEPEKEPKPTIDDRRKELLDEGKMKAEVKVKVKEHEKRLMGNSKLLQRMDGKIEKR